MAGEGVSASSGLAIKKQTAAKFRIFISFPGLRLMLITGHNVVGPRESMAKRIWRVAIPELLHRGWERRRVCACGWSRNGNVGEAEYPLPGPNTPADHQNAQ